MNRSVVLLGGPDSGKTNYVGRVWPALEAGKGRLHSTRQPDDIRFVLEVTDHLGAGHFAPRSEHADQRRDFEVVVAEHSGGDETTIVIPDISGELWQNAVRDGEIATEWMEELRRAHGALLFVRVGSDLDVRPLDWVASRSLMARLGIAEDPGMPTQVMLCELLRFLESSLTDRPDDSRPRVSIVVSAWDLVDAGTFAKGPRAYIEHEYPLFGGLVGETDALAIKVFGLSVVGGDLKVDGGCRDAVQEHGLDGLGWVAMEEGDGQWVKDPDLTLPVAWVVGS